MKQYKVGDLKKGRVYAGRLKEYSDKLYGVWVEERQCLLSVDRYDEVSVTLRLEEGKHGLEWVVVQLHDLEDPEAKHPWWKFWKRKPQLPKAQLVKENNHA